MCKKECVICGKEFVARWNSEKTCSDECQKVRKRRLDRERKKRKATIEKVCLHCGKKFFTHEKVQRYCCSSCGALARKDREYRMKEPGLAGEDVRIRITDYIPVYEHLRPVVNEVYEAKKMACLGNDYVYAIPNIGKYGLIVRSKECEEIGGI